MHGTESLDCLLDSIFDVLFLGNVTRDAKNALLQSCMKLLKKLNVHVCYGD